MLCYRLQNNEILGAAVFMFSQNRIASGLPGAKYLSFIDAKRIDYIQSFCLKPLTTSPSHAALWFGDA